MQGSLQSSYGFDPSLRHGALVHASFMFQVDKAFLASATLIYSWKPSHPLSLTENSPPSDVFFLIDSIITSFPSLAEGSIVAIDYDDRAAYWTKRPGQVAKLQFLSGYFAKASHYLGCPTVMLAPSTVRRFLGLPMKGDKVEVWQAFCSVVELGSHCPRKILDLEDARDALVLAYIVAAAAMEQFNESRLTETDLPGRRAPPGDAIQAAVEAIAAKRSPVRSRHKRDRRGSNPV